MMKKSVLVALGCALACLMVASKAHAEAFKFTFDYSVNAGGPLTGPGGPWGSVIISDSALDSNRVDILLTITPPAAFTTLNQFFLNLDLQPDSPPVGNDPDALAKSLNYLVPVTNTAGNLTGANAVGTLAYSNGTFALNGFVFDLNPNPTSTALTFSSSWALYIDNDSPTPDTPVDLNARMFLTPSVLSGGQTIPMYAAYRVDNGLSNTDSNFREFRGYASTAAPIPEPATLSLLGVGLLGVARLRRRRS